MAINRDFIGRSFPVSEPYQIGRELIRNFATAIKDTNPIYHDVEASYDWSGLVIRAGINNLTDRDPPYSRGEGNTNEATYRLLGRTYFLRVSFTLK